MLSISKSMRGKMFGMLALNTSPLENSFCMLSSTKDKDKYTCGRCYAMRAIKYRPLVRKVYAENTRLLSKRIPIAELPLIGHRFFRFHGFGELVNKEHFINFANIASKNPGTTFALWTKRPELCITNIVPRNMILIYSMHQIDSTPFIPPGFHKVYSVVSSRMASLFGGLINCEGQCITCLKCYRKSEPNVIFAIAKP